MRCQSKQDITGKTQCVMIPIVPVLAAVATRYALVKLIFFATDIYNECGSSPCRSGATCEDKVGEFLCHCVHGYSGDTCDDGRYICRWYTWLQRAAGLQELLRISWFTMYDLLLKLKQPEAVPLSIANKLKTPKYIFIFRPTNWWHKSLSMFSAHCAPFSNNVSVDI